MKTKSATAAIPDYGWASAEAEGSHSYLEPAVLGWLQRHAARRKRPEPMRVFDAGCGNGALLARMAEQGYTVAGCDASASGIEHARDRHRNLNIKQMSVYADMATAFGTNWDVVVATEVIEHLYAPREFIAQASRLLRPDGYLLLTTPYHSYAKNLVMAVTGKLDRHFTALWDGGHIKFWSYRTLRQLLREFEFGEFEFYGAGRCPGLWKSMVVACRRRSV